MLFYNPNIRRITTYKISPLWGEASDNKELYSYSVFTEYKVKELFLNKQEIAVYKYNPSSNFLDSMEVYNVKSELIRRYYFDIIENNQDNIFEFKESCYYKDKNVCHGSIKKMIQKIMILCHFIVLIVI